MAVAEELVYRLQKGKSALVTAFKGPPRAATPPRKPVPLQGKPRASESRRFHGAFLACPSRVLGVVLIKTNVLRCIDVAAGFFFACLYLVFCVIVLWFRLWRKVRRRSLGTHWGACGKISRKD